MLQPNPNIEKKIFYGLAGLLLVIMPLLSLKSGISGDEATYHYPHGKNVYNYYASLGKDTTCLHYEKSDLRMYGPVFDVLTVAAVKIFKPDDEYVLRHIMNSLTGWAALLFAALIAVMLGGWRAGIITLLFMFLSPRFLGHSYNNPKDIPFTAAYIYTLYAIIGFLKNYPLKKYHFGWQIALGIGLAIGVRIGGILLAFYFVMGIGLQYLFTHHIKQYFIRENLQKLFNLLLLAALICLVGYIIGIFLWPYGHKSPVAHTLEAMKQASAGTDKIRQLFEGKILWSDYFPKYYLPKYISMTIPEFVMIGLALFFIFIQKAKKQNIPWYIILLFTSIFPVAYIIHKNSNVYGGWRHLIFIYPGLAAIAALGWNELIGMFKKISFKIPVYIILTALLILPFLFIIRNHPHEYIYYNSVSGGVKKAYSKYEMDYFYHSLRAGSEWLIKNKIDKTPQVAGNKIVVATNHLNPVLHYFRNDTSRVKLVYIRYYERGDTYWDYAIVANSYIDPYQLKRKTWPPANTIHTIDVDKQPICAVIERKDKNDFLAYQMMAMGNIQGAIECYRKAIQSDKNYEIAYYNLSEAYLKAGEYNNAIQTASACLRIYPDFNKAYIVLGMAYLNQQQPENALNYFNKAIKINPKYVVPYYYLGVIYAQTNDFQMALKYLQKALETNYTYKPTYYLVARIYELMGNKAEAQKYIKFAASLP